MASSWYDSRGGTNITRTRNNVTMYVTLRMIYFCRSIQIYCQCPWTGRVGTRSNHTFADSWENRHDSTNIQHSPSDIPLPLLKSTEHHSVFAANPHRVPWSSFRIQVYILIISVNILNISRYSESQNAAGQQLTAATPLPTYYLQF